MTLHVKDLDWSAGGQHIVNHVTCDIAPGSFVGLLGPNGSGKTSLLRLVAALTTPDMGAVILDGTNVHSLHRRIRAQRLSLLQQHATTEDDITVLDVVMLGRTPYRQSIWSNDNGEEAYALTALQQVGLGSFTDRLWNTLSGGEQQRVQLARAIVQEPDVLLLDEPTNHLDIHHQLKLLHLVRESKVTTFAALHDLNLAAMFCDELIVMQDGHIAVMGTVQEVLTTELIRKVYQVTGHISAHPETGLPHVTYASLY